MVSSIASTVIGTGAQEVLGAATGSSTTSNSKGKWKRYLFMGGAAAGVGVGIYSKTIGNNIAMGTAIGLAVISALAFLDNRRNQDLRSIQQTEKSYKAAIAAQKKENEEYKKLIEAHESELDRLEKALKKRSQQILDLREQVTESKRSFKELTPKIDETNKDFVAIIARLKAMNADLQRRMTRVLERDARQKERIERVLKAVQEQGIHNAQQQAIAKDLKTISESRARNERLLKARVEELEAVGSELKNFDASTQRLAETSSNITGTLDKFRQTLREARQLRLSDD